MADLVTEIPEVLRTAEISPPTDQNPQGDLETTRTTRRPESSSLARFSLSPW